MTPEYCVKPERFLLFGECQDVFEKYDPVRRLVHQANCTYTKPLAINRVSSYYAVKLGNSVREVVWRIENQDNKELPEWERIGNLKHYPYPV